MREAPPRVESKMEESRIFWYEGRAVTVLESVKRECLWFKILVEKMRCPLLYS
jgi:hypothetical protein